MRAPVKGKFKSSAVEGALAYLKTAQLAGRIGPGTGVRVYLACGVTDILDRIHDHKINRLDELLPWNWTPLASVKDRQAA